MAEVDDEIKLNLDVRTEEAKNRLQDIETELNKINDVMKAFASADLSKMSLDDAKKQFAEINDLISKFVKHATRLNTEIHIPFDDSIYEKLNRVIAKYDELAKKRYKIATTTPSSGDSGGDIGGKGGGTPPPFPPPSGGDSGSAAHFKFSDMLTVLKNILNVINGQITGGGRGRSGYLGLFSKLFGSAATIRAIRSTITYYQNPLHDNYKSEMVKNAATSAIGGGFGGALMGLRMGGPWGALIGGVSGLLLGGVMSVFEGSTRRRNELHEGQYSFASKELDTLRGYRKNDSDWAFSKMLGMYSRGEQIKMRADRAQRIRGLLHPTIDEEESVGEGKKASAGPKKPEKKKVVGKEKGKDEEEYKAYCDRAGPGRIDRFLKSIISSFGGGLLSLGAALCKGIKSLFANAVETVESESKRSVKGSAKEKEKESKKEKESGRVPTLWSRIKRDGKKILKWFGLGNGEDKPSEGEDEEVPEGSAKNESGGFGKKLLKTALRYVKKSGGLIGLVSRAVDKCIPDSSEDEASTDDGDKSEDQKNKNGAKGRKNTGSGVLQPDKVLNPDESETEEKENEQEQNETPDEEEKAKEKIDRLFAVKKIEARELDEDEEKELVESVHDGSFKNTDLTSLRTALRAALNQGIDPNKDANFKKIQEMYHSQQNRAEGLDSENRRAMLDPDQIMAAYTGASHVNDAMSRQGFFVGSTVDVQDVNKDILTEVRKVTPLLREMAKREVDKTDVGFLANSNFQ